MPKKREKLGFRWTTLYEASTMPALSPHFVVELISICGRGHRISRAIDWQPLNGIREIHNSHFQYPQVAHLISMLTSHLNADSLIRIEWCAREDGVWFFSVSIHPVSNGFPSNRNELLDFQYAFRFRCCYLAYTNTYSHTSDTEIMNI